MQVASDHQRNLPSVCRACFLAESQWPVPTSRTPVLVASWQETKVLPEEAALAATMAAGAAATSVMTAHREEQDARAAEQALKLEEKLTSLLATHADAHASELDSYHNEAETAVEAKVAGQLSYGTTRPRGSDNVYSNETAM